MSREDAEDLVQDTFVRPLEQLPGIEVRPDAAFIAYLARVAHGTIVNRLAHHDAEKREVARERSLDRGAGRGTRSGLRETLASLSSSPSGKASRAEQVAVLADAVQRRLE